MLQDQHRRMDDEENKDTISGNELIHHIRLTGTTSEFHASRRTRVLSHPI